MAARKARIEDPALAKWLFNDPKSAWLWLILRVYLGYQWINAGLHKVADPAWVGTGNALKGFWERGLAMQPKPVITYDWYREFIRGLLEGGHYTWFAKLVAYGELLVGVALVAGALTGFAAFAGAFMNFNFMLAGTASTNPVLFVIAIMLFTAWKVAGEIGVDRWLLPALGTPWGDRVPAPVNAVRQT